MNLYRLPYIMVICVAIVSCKSAQTLEPIETDPISPDWKLPVQNTNPDGLKADIGKISKLQFVDAETMRQHMNYLASDDLKGRDTGSEGIAIAAKYLETQLGLMGVAPYFETYKDTLSNFKKTAFNVVGVLEGTDAVLKDEYILIGAHYDHIGTVTPENGDYIANGANDNASGTTTILELAHYFGKHKTNKRSLIFAFFSAEEKGLLGSEHLAKKLKAAYLNLYTMLNFEMTGVPLKSKDYLVYITGYDYSNLAEVCNGYTDEKMVGYLPTAKEYNLFKRSDNYPFYQAFGVPSHTYCTFDFTNFEYYHKPGDEVSEIDFEHMADVVNKMIPVLEGVANAPTQEIKMAN